MAPPPPAVFLRLRPRPAQRPLRRIPNETIAILSAFPVGSFDSFFSCSGLILTWVLSESFNPWPQASASSSLISGVAELAKVVNVQPSEVFVFRPEGVQQESPGQRPGWQVNHDFQALKGRNTLCRPFRACGFPNDPYPGRCPGLSCSALSGQRISDSRSVPENSVFTALGEIPANSVILSLQLEDAPSSDSS